MDKEELSKWEKLKLKMLNDKFEVDLERKTYGRDFLRVSGLISFHNAEMFVGTTEIDVWNLWPRPVDKAKQHAQFLAVSFCFLSLFFG